MGRKDQMIASVFTCPATGGRVHRWLEVNDDALDNQYEVITCPACKRLHFVNGKTGKLFEEEVRKRASA
jgi:uncharacterized protein YbaR (Trm112 family)